MQFSFEGEIAMDGDENDDNGNFDDEGVKIGVSEKEELEVHQDEEEMKRFSVEKMEMAEEDENNDDGYCNGEDVREVVSVTNDDGTDDAEGCVAIKNDKFEVASAESRKYQELEQEKEELEVNQDEEEMKRFSVENIEMVEEDENNDNGYYNDEDVKEGVSVTNDDGTDDAEGCAAIKNDKFEVASAENIKYQELEQEKEELEVNQDEEKMKRFSVEKMVMPEEDENNDNGDFDGNCSNNVVVEVEEDNGAIEDGMGGGSLSEFDDTGGIARPNASEFTPRTREILPGAFAVRGNGRINVDHTLPDESSETMTVVLGRLGVHMTDAVAVEVADDNVMVVTGISNAEEIRVPNGRSSIEVADNIRRPGCKIRLAIGALLGVTVIAAVVFGFGYRVGGGRDPVPTTFELPSQPPTDYSAPSTTPSFAPSLSPTIFLPEWTQLGDDILGRSQKEQSGHVALNSGDGTVLAVGGIEGEGEPGVVRVYRSQASHFDSDGSSNITTPYWMQLGSNILDPTPSLFPHTGFGGFLHLSRDGTVLAVGSPFLNDFTGGVYTFMYNPEEGDWIPLGLNGGLLTAPYSFMFGRTVALSGDGTRIAVFAQNFVRIYDYMATKGAWELVGADVREPSTTDGADKAKDIYGGDLSEDGSLLVLQFVDGIAEVYVLNSNGEQWIRLGNVMRFGDATGLSLSADGSTVAISNIFDGVMGINSGAVRAYRFDTVKGNWTQMGSINTYGIDAGDKFGHCLSLSQDGNRLAAGSGFHMNESGLVRVLDWNGEEWVQISKDIIGKPNQGVGTYCSFTGSRIALGSPTYALNSGLVKVFELQ